MAVVKNTPLVCAAVLVCLTGPVRAQSYSWDYGIVGAPMSSFLNDSYLSNHYLMEDVIKHLPAGDVPDKTAALVVATPGKGRMAAQLARNYPAAQQSQAKALFEDLLRRYGQLEAQFDIPHGDLGGALAAYVAGSWMGQNDASFPDAYFLPLVEQMRAALAAEPDLLGSPEADRRDMYEQLAIIGMMLAATQMSLQQNPDAAASARMRDAAQGYLQVLFKGDANQVTIGPDGVSLR